MQRVIQLGLIILCAIWNIYKYNLSTRYQNLREKPLRHAEGSRSTREFLKQLGEPTEVDLAILTSRAECRRVRSMHNGGTQRIVGPKSEVHSPLARLEGAVLEVVAGTAKDGRING